jgi:CheY-specific phosphatase CheX
MTETWGIPRKVIESVIEKTRSHFEDVVDIGILSTTFSSGEISELALRDITAIVGIGSPFKVMVAFSFDNPLAKYLTEIETRGLEITDDARQQFLLEAVAETINIVLGHCTSDLAENGNVVTLSPPVVVHMREESQIYWPKGASFATTGFVTDRGILDVDFIVPNHLFDKELKSLFKGGQHD